jgi:hypothetical protein
MDYWAGYRNFYRIEIQKRVAGDGAKKTVMLGIKVIIMVQRVQANMEKRCRHQSENNDTCQRRQAMNFCFAMAHHGVLPCKHYFHVPKICSSPHPFASASSVAWVISHSLCKNIRISDAICSASQTFTGPSFTCAVSAFCPGPISHAP